LLPYNVSLSPDGRHVLTTTGDDSVPGVACVCDAATGQPLTPPLRHGAKIEKASFSPDGRFVLTTGDGKARAWESATALPITAPFVHGRRVDLSSFSPDSRRLLLASGDTVWWWDLSADNRPVDDLVRLGQVLSGIRVNANGVTLPIGVEELRGDWPAVRSK